MTISNELLDELLKDYKKPEDLVGKDGLLKHLTKRLVERAMEGELTAHLGYDKNSPIGDNSGNSRNGKTSKTLKGDFGEMEIKTPRDRNVDFQPQIVKRGRPASTGSTTKFSPSTPPASPPVKSKCTSRKSTGSRFHPT